MYSGIHEFPESRVFTLYNHLKGNCGELTLRSHGGCHSVQDALQECLRLPQCTFFSYYADERFVHLCQGKFGLEGDLDTKGAPVPSSGWISGDVKGCETVARADRMNPHAPSCRAFSGERHQSVYAYSV
jgi:hypothetical protein